MHHRIDSGEQRYQLRWFPKIVPDNLGVTCGRSRASDHGTNDKAACKRLQGYVAANEPAGPGDKDSHQRPGPASGNLAGTVSPPAPALLPKRLASRELVIVLPMEGWEHRSSRGDVRQRRMIAGNLAAAHGSCYWKRSPLRSD